MIFFRQTSRKPRFSTITARNKVFIKTKTRFVWNKDCTKIKVQQDLEQVLFQKQAQTRFGTTFVPKTKGTKFVPRLQFFLTLSYFFQNKLLEPRRLAVKKCLNLFHNKLFFLKIVTSATHFINSSRMKKFMYQKCTQNCEAHEKS